MTDKETIGRFEQAVVDCMNTHNLSRERAISAVRRSQPELTQAYLLATNKSMAAQRMLREKFDSLNV